MWHVAPSHGLPSHAFCDLHATSVKIRQRQRVTGIHWRRSSQAERRKQNHLDLLFSRAPIAGDSLFHRSGRILHNFRFGLRGGEQTHAAHMPQLECGIRITTQKNPFHDGDLRLIVRENRHQLTSNSMKPLMEPHGGGGRDHSVGKMANPITVALDNAETRMMTAWVNAQDDFHVVIEQRRPCRIQAN